MKNPRNPSEIIEDIRAVMPWARDEDTMISTQKRINETSELFLELVEVLASAHSSRD